MFIYEHIVTLIDSSHIKRTLTFLTEKEHTDSDVAPSPTNDTK
jgi:hypothetical protein